MNAREGMRRVGLFLGVLGGITGGVVGYSDLQGVWGLHERFDRLQSLDVMNDVRKAIKAYQDFEFILPGLVPKGATIDKHTESERSPNPPTVPIPKGAVVEPAPTSQSFTDIKPLDSAPPVTLDLSTSVPIYPGQSTCGFGPVCVARKAAASEKAADPAAEIGVDVNNQDGIVRVDADKTGAISAIQLATGEWVLREPGTFKAHMGLISRLLLPLCYPAIGFLLPWGAIKVLVWVASGFFAPKGTV
jgi:hypothetical protein